MGVTASLVVSFGKDAESDAILIAEVDSRSLTEGGLNNGRSQFLPGDTVTYLVYKHKLSSTTHRPSAGSISQGPINQGRQIEEVVTFFDTVEGSVRYPIYSLDSVEWLGNNLGAMTAPGGTQLRAAAPGVAVAIVKYTTRYDVWRINSPSQINGRDTFDIAILVTGVP